MNDTPLRRGHQRPPSAWRKKMVCTVDACGGQFRLAKKHDAWMLRCDKCGCLAGKPVPSMTAGGV